MPVCRYDVDAPNQSGHYGGSASAAYPPNVTPAMRPMP